jgi:hypothetical protein
MEEFVNFVKIYKSSIAHAQTCGGSVWRADATSATERSCAQPCGEQVQEDGKQGAAGAAAAGGERRSPSQSGKAADAET